MLAHHYADKPPQNSMENGRRKNSSIPALRTHPAIKDGEVTPKNRRWMPVYQFIKQTWSSVRQVDSPRHTCHDMGDERSKADRPEGDKAAKVRRKVRVMASEMNCRHFALRRVAVKMEKVRQRRCRGLLIRHSLSLMGLPMKHRSWGTIQPHAAEARTRANSIALFFGKADSTDCVHSVTGFDMLSRPLTI